MQKTVTVCDVCQDPSLPTEHYSIALPGGETAELDLCVNDSAPLWSLVNGREVPDPPEDPPGLVREPFVPTPRPSSHTGARTAVKTAPTKAPAKKVAPRRGGGTGRTPVMTMEQIEAAKRSA